MIAHVIPFIKLPRNVSFFDYVVPTSPTYTCGDVVRIPFRHREIFGVIIHLVDEPSQRSLKPLGERIALHIPEDHREYLLSIAQTLGQSPASIFAVAYEGLSANAQTTPLPPRIDHKISQADPRRIAQVKELLEGKSADILSVASDDEVALLFARAQAKGQKGQTLLLVPRIRDAMMFSSILPSSQFAVLTGQTPRVQRNAIIRAWQSGALPILIATRQGALLAPHCLTNIIVFQAACEDHESTLRNPHISTLDAAVFLARISKAKAMLFDAIPPLLQGAQTHFLSSGVTPRVIDVQHREEKTAIPLISNSLLTEIKLALHSKKKVLLSFN